jgi:hypothetical protein
VPQQQPAHCSSWLCRDVSQLDHLPVTLPDDPAAVRVAVVLDPIRRGDVEAESTDPLSPAVAKAFCAAGYDVTSRADLERLGVYVTYATKCPKVGFGLSAETVEACSHLLEAEIDRLPNLHSMVLAGETAIRSINAIAQRRYNQPAIPRGSAYKIMGHEYRLGDILLIPSYPQQGGHAVETDTSAMIAVDLQNAVESATAPTRPQTPRPDRGAVQTRPADHRTAPSAPGPR